LDDIEGSAGIQPYHRRMSPRSRPGSRAAATRRRGGAASGAALAVVGILALALAGCTAGSFDPTGPCTIDGSSAGAYPEMEAQVPRAFRGTAPAQVDSGRTCTTRGLGALTSHGITELRFAGSTWSTGTDSGLTLALFRSEGPAPLTVDWLTEFYEVGAKSGKNVESVTPSDMHVDGSVMGRRIDVLNGESFQTVVVWERGGRIEAAIVANFVREIQTREAHDAIVRDAVDAWNKADAVGK
jgi:hypothetical protein